MWVPLRNALTSFQNTMYDKFRSSCSYADKVISSLDEYDIDYEQRPQPKRFVDLNKKSKSSK